MVPGTDVKLEDRYVVRQPDQQTDTDMQTDRQLLIWYLVKMSNSGTDIWSYRPTDRHTDRQTAMDMVPGKDVKLKDGDVVGQTGRQTNRQTYRQTGRQTNRQTYTQAGRQADRHTDRQTDTDRQLRDMVPGEDVKLKDRDVVGAGKVNGRLECS